MSTLERRGVQRVLAMAAEAGLPVPDELAGLVEHLESATVAGNRWAQLHPDDDGTGCCWGDIQRGPAGCTCWMPVFDVDQAQPRPPAGPQDITVRDEKCFDCAYRPGSPERSDPVTAQALYDVARGGEPFWCHQGMRRPIRYEHPDGRVLDGSPDDWQPPMTGGIPYKADGSPAQLCAGWAAIAAATGKDQPGEAA